MGALERTNGLGVDYGSTYFAFDPSPASFRVDGGLCGDFGSILFDITISSGNIPPFSFPPISAVPRTYTLQALRILDSMEIRQWKAVSIYTITTQSLR